MSGRAAPSGQRETRGRETEKQARQSPKKKKKKRRETEKRGQGWTPSYLFFPLLLCRSKKHFIFLPRLKKKGNSFSWNWQVFVSGQLTIFSLPVMKVVAGVNALGGNGGLFIPLKAQRHTCFAWSVICNCGISWEAQQQSTLCFERAPSARLKSAREKKKKKGSPPTQLWLRLFLYFHVTPSTFLSLTALFYPSLPKHICVCLTSHSGLFGYFGCFSLIINNTDANRKV